jgi:hypothetical protein
MDRDIPVRISLTELTADRRAWLLHRGSASRVRIVTLAALCTEAG